MPPSYLLREHCVFRGEGQLDFSGVETQRQRIFVIETSKDRRIREFVDWLASRVPELRAKHFWVKEKKETASYGPGPKQRIGGHRVYIERLTIERTSPGIFQIDVQYARPTFRPFLFIFTLIGLCFGLVPGLIIYLVFRESEADQVKRVAPALSRFATLVTTNSSGDDEEPTVEAPVAIELSMSTSASISDRLKRLDEILAAGAISADEHQQQRARILSEI